MQNIEIESFTTPSPPQKYITPSGIEFDFIKVLENATKLEEFRRQNQVHFNRISTQNRTTIFVCTRNPTAQGNCQYKLLAKEVEGGCYHMYENNTHNHVLTPIKLNPTIDPTNHQQRKRNNLLTAKRTLFKKPNKFRKNKSSMVDKKMPFKSNVLGRQLTMVGLAPSFEHLESKRRAQQLVIDRQTNVVDGVPGTVSYRCREGGMQCPFELIAISNPQTGVFELYEPEQNGHVHSKNKNRAENSSATSSASISPSETVLSQQPTSSSQNHLSLVSARQPNRPFPNSEAPTDHTYHWRHLANFNSDEQFHAFKIANQLHSAENDPRLFQCRNRNTTTNESCPYRLYADRPDGGSIYSIFVHEIHNHAIVPGNGEEVELVRHAELDFGMNSIGEENPNPLDLLTPPKATVAPATRSLVKVNLADWRHLGETDSEANWEKFRRLRRVLPLQMPFHSLHQATVKCNRKGTKNGYCPYRILLFRNQPGGPVQIYERARHCHPLGSLAQNQESSRIISQINTRRGRDNTAESDQIEGTGGADGPVAESFPAAASSSVEIEGGMANDTVTAETVAGTSHQTPTIMCLADYELALRNMAKEFNLGLSLERDSIMFKFLEPAPPGREHNLLMLLEQGDVAIYVDEWSNGGFTGQSENWQKGDALCQKHFLSAVRGRLHEFCTGQQFGYTKIGPEM